jgi:hypothetical protein
MSSYMYMPKLCPVCGCYYSSGSRCGCSSWSGGTRLSKFGGMDVAGPFLGDLLADGKICALTLESKAT